MHHRKCKKHWLHHKDFQEASGNQKKQEEIKKIDLKRMTVGFIGAMK